MKILKNNTIAIKFCHLKDYMQKEIMEKTGNSAWNFSEKTLGEVEAPVKYLATMTFTLSQEMTETELEAYFVELVEAAEFDHEDRVLCKATCLIIEEGVFD